MNRMSETKTGAVSRSDEFTRGTVHGMRSAALAILQMRAIVASPLASSALREAAAGIKDAADETEAALSLATNGRKL